MTNVRSTQTGIEGVIAGSPNVRLTQAAVEVVLENSSASSVQLTQVGIEVLIQNWAPSPAVTNFATAVYPQFIRGLAFPVMKSHQFSTTSTESTNLLSVRILNAQNPVWHFTLIYNYLKDNPQDVLAVYSPQTDYQVLRGFCESMAGQFGEFLFRDATDNSVGPAVGDFPWQQNRVYLPGAIILDPADHAQLAVTVNGPTGSTIPTFNDSGGSITDNGNVVWQDLGLASGPLPNPNAQLRFFGDGSYSYSPIQRNFGGQFLEDITDLNTNTALGGTPLQVYVNGSLMQSSGYQVLGPGLKLSSTMYYGAYIRFNPWSSFATFSSGNLLIDPAGHLQQATTNGAVGALSPDWNDSGGTTLDAGVLWQDLGLATTVTAQFKFFFRVRFESDQQDIEQFMQQLWTIGGPDSKNGSGMLKLVTARPAPLPPCPCELFAAHRL